jgi:hypothetical protein
MRRPPVYISQCVLELALHCDRHVTVMRQIAAAHLHVAIEQIECHLHPCTQQQMCWVIVWPFISVHECQKNNMQCHNTKHHFIGSKLAKSTVRCSWCAVSDLVHARRCKQMLCYQQSEIYPEETAYIETSSLT